MWVFTDYHHKRVKYFLDKPSSLLKSQYFLDQPSSLLKSQYFLDQPSSLLKSQYFLDKPSSLLKLYLSEYDNKDVFKDFNFDASPPSIRIWYI